MITKESVEAIPLGQLQFSLPASPFWSIEENQQKLAAKIQVLWHGIQDWGLSGCLALRHVCATENFLDEVNRWQQSLGEPTGATQTPSAVAVGKTITWGDGSENATFSVIILFAQIAEGIEAENPLAVGLFVHELAHTHTDALLLRKFGKDAPVAPSDWPGIRRTLAKTVWTEFVSEAVAAPFFQNQQLEPSVTCVVDLLTEAMTSMSLHHSEYQRTRDMDALWRSGIKHEDQVFAQLGRVIGHLHGSDITLETYAVLSRITAISPTWASLAKKLDAELRTTRVSTFSAGNLTALESLVTEAFACLNLAPRESPNGLWVSIV